MTRRTAPRPLKDLPRPAGLFVVANILARTAEMAATLEAPAKGEPKEPVDKRLQDIANCIEARFGCHREQTRELVQLILTATLPEPTVADASGHRSTPIQFVPGALLVRGGGSTVLVHRTDSDGDAHFYTEQVAEGGYIDALETVRAPTQHEIDAFLKAAGLAD